MAKKGSLSISSENIFPIIKKWVYSDHDIFFREMVSNGCDAITKLKKLDMMGEYQLPDDYKPQIRVVVSPEDKTLKFIDDGLGMTEDEVEEYITQIAFSGATEFLEKSVLEDYKEFQEVSVQYQADADAYGDNMNKVKDAIDKLTALTETSAEALDGIKDTVNESATGVTDIAQKTSDMVEKTVDIHDKVTECYGCADELNNIVAKFKLK